MTRDQKLQFHLEEVISMDLPDGVTANAAEMDALCQQATPDQKMRALGRALTRQPILTKEERT